MDNCRLRILLVEDDEDDYILTRDLLSGVEGDRFDLDWVATYAAALETIGRNEHDVYLLDYILGERSGLDLLREAVDGGCNAPIIMLTGQGTREVDIEAMKAGAAEYLVKTQLNAALLERSVRYSLERKRAEAENAKLYEQVKRHANELELLVKTSLIASSSLNLEQVLQALAEHMARQLQVTLCRICLLDHEKRILTVRATFPIRNVPWEPGIGQGFDLERLPWHRQVVELQGTQVFRQDALDSDLSKIERDLVLPEETRSSLLMAMVAKGHTLGTITLVEARAWERNPFTDQKIDLCHAMASHAAMSVENAILFEDRARTHFATLTALAAALDAREHETHAHCWRVREYTLTLARNMGIHESLLDDIATGALLHDVGKIGVSDRILLKPGKLTEEEWEEMKKHPAIGYEILKGIKPLRAAREIVYSHHERYDGKGYPQGSAGDAIPVGARIFAVADTFDAITSDRSYRKRRNYEMARTEILEGSGTQFDPQVVDVFLRVPEEEWERVKVAAEHAPYWFSFY